jgi:multicomponent Na+:H+ antiporter subunit G
MQLLLDALSWLALLGGGFFVLAGGIGVYRLPDFYTRLHGAGVTDTLGAGLILLGLAFQAGLSLVAVKLGLILALMLFTGPTATHVLAKAALHGGLKPQLPDAPGGDSSNN